MKNFGLVAVAAAVVAIGCGGAGTADTNFDASTATTATTASTASTATNGSTNTTATTGGVEDPSPFRGTFQGDFTGSNTSGARYNGDGSADIAADGSATFSYTALLPGNVQVIRTFTGTVSATGAFTGKTDSGENATGTVVLLDTQGLQASLKWDKRTSSGSVFYTSTETFTLDRKDGL